MGKYTGYRPNVAAIILSSDYDETLQFMIARRTGIKRGWQFPQGGVDDGETPEEALLRELQEEIGTDKVDILGEYPGWIRYDFPKVRTIKVYPYKGQSQRYFLVKLKKDAVIDLNLHNTPEFDEHMLVTMEELFRKVSYLKRPTYKKVIDYFRNKGKL